MMRILWCGLAILSALPCAAAQATPGGNDWTPLAPLSTGAAVGSPGGTHPVATDGDTVHVVWFQDGNIHYRRSTDCGRTWGHTVAVTSSGTAQYPCSLERTGSTLHLIWPDSRDGTWEVYSKRSTDGGNTWGEDRRLTHGVDLFRMGTAASGSAIHIVWASRSLVSPTPAGTHTWGELYYLRSTDSGETWERQVRLTAPDSTAMRPSVAASGRYVHLTWFDRRDSEHLLDWHIYYKRSTDGGATWGPDTPMGAILTFPHHPEIAATPGGKVCIVWEDGQTFDGATWGGDPALYASVSTDNGMSWSKQERITHVNAPHGWATHAKIHAYGSRLHLVWTDGPEGPPRQPQAAFYMTSPDGGLTWGQPEQLTAPADGEYLGHAVGGTERYAVALMGRGDAICCRQRAITR